MFVVPFGQTVGEGGIIARCIQDALQAFPGILYTVAGTRRHHDDNLLLTAGGEQDCHQRGSE